MDITSELIDVWKDKCRDRVSQIRAEKEKLAASGEHARADALAHEMSGIAQAISFMQELLGTSGS